MALFSEIVDRLACVLEDTRMPGQSYADLTCCDNVTDYNSFIEYVGDDLLSSGGFYATEFLDTVIEDSDDERMVTMCVKLKEDIFDFFLKN